MGRVEPDSLYWRDPLEWSEQQTAALRALVGRRDLPNALDVDNLIGELEALGRSQLNAATSLIRLILEHLIKLHARPAALSTRHWQAEVLGSHAELGQSYSPGMRQRVDLDGLWRTAGAIARKRLGGIQGSFPPLPEACPLPLEAFLGEEFDLDAALAAIAAAG